MLFKDPEDNASQLNRLGTADSSTRSRRLRGYERLGMTNCLLLRLYRRTAEGHCHFLSAQFLAERKLSRSFDPGSNQRPTTNDQRLIFRVNFMVKPNGRLVQVSCVC